MLQRVLSTWSRLQTFVRLSTGVASLSIAARRAPGSTLAAFIVEDIRRRHDALLLESPICEGSGHGLGLGVNEIIHDDHVASGCFRKTIPAGNPHQKDTLAGVKPYSQE